MAFSMRKAFSIFKVYQTVSNRSFQTSMKRSDRVLSEVCKMKPVGGIRWYSSQLSLNDQFAQSQKQVTTLGEEPDNDMKLKLYALFKQATVGKCNAKKPGALDFVGKAKWQAWDSLQTMSQDKAKQQYVETVGSLLAADAAGQNVASNADSGSNYSVPGLLVEKKKGYLQITFNRPDKKNAITSEMYEAIPKLLSDSANDDSISFVAFRGQGDYYCSGNDLGNFTKYMAQNMSIPEMAKISAVLLRKYVSSYIEFPKPLVAIINGPAVGIAVTVLGLFDIIYATDKATFQTPFSALAQSPEGCSTYTFPKLMGYAQANEILMLNKKVTAAEAKQLRLVSDVFPHATFEQETEKRLAEMASLPRLSLAYVRQETRSTEIEMLRKLNNLECELITERWQSEDCKRAIAAFFSRKSKI